ncbi:unnamed protein product [Prunus armeniaca]|uniref:Uncharacterized protein n=1 Tax=Prunus armeniaca TaxID=36596 RepID=A0A6J5V392_PRUAR|nr:unnamed protein product [Prunus armeniaca]
MVDWAPVLLGLMLFILLSPGLLFQYQETPGMSSLEASPQMARPFLSTHSFSLAFSPSSYWLLASTSTLADRT